MFSRLRLRSQVAIAQMVTIDMTDDHYVNITEPWGFLA